MDDKTLEERLYAIVLSHTVVGGYPDCRAIARDAYALAMQDAGMDMRPTSTGQALMRMERTVWIGGSREEEALDLDAWIVNAGNDDLEHLLKRDLSVTNAQDQQRLAEVWRDASYDMDMEPDMHDSRGETVTYHWGEGERLALNQAVKTLRPQQLEPDPTQGNLF